jgi:hypothetical protein
MRNSVYGNMQHFATSIRQEMAMAKEIDKELQRQKKLAAKASKGGGVIPDYIRFDLDPTARQRLAHNIISKFANCSNEEVIELVKDADGIYKTQTA